MEAYATWLLLGFLFSTTMVFVVLVLRTRLGVTKSLIVTLLLAKFWIAVLALLGVDRPLLVIRTRLGAVTLTAMEILFISTLATNIWMAKNTEQLRKILG